MTRWDIKLPIRDPSLPIYEMASDSTVLEPEDGQVVRALVVQATIDGCHTCGDLVDFLEAASPEERRQRLDNARQEAGLETAIVDATQHRRCASCRGGKRQ
jgi:hypothetical protein